MSDFVVRRTNGPRGVCLEVSGELDIYTAPQVLRAVESAAFGGADVVLDLHGLTFIDCAGLGTLLAGRSAAVAHGGSLALSSPSRPVRRLLGLTQQQALLSSPSPFTTN